MGLTLAKVATILTVGVTCRAKCFNAICCKCTATSAWYCWAPSSLEKLHEGSRWCSLFLQSMWMDGCEEWQNLCKVIPDWPLCASSPGEEVRRDPAYS